MTPDTDYNNNNKSIIHDTWKKARSIKWAIEVERRWESGKGAAKERKQLQQKRLNITYIITQQIMYF